MQEELTVLELTPAWAAVVKPAGMESEKEVPEKLGVLAGGSFYPVHRLDRQVGGVMVYARNREAAAALSDLIAKGLFCKEYQAVCHGNLPSEGEMRDLLWKDVRQNKVFVVQRMRSGVREAVLRYRVEEPAGEADGLCRVRIRLLTGRSHQIRVQFASRKHPLAGDHKYGARDRMKNPMLFSCAVSFLWEGREIRYEAEAPWEKEKTAELLPLQGPGK